MVLWDVLHFLIEYAKENQIILKTTIGSTAYNTVSHELDVKPEQWNNFDWKFARAGYYGGRCEVYQTTCDAGYVVDRNSSYSAALVETPVPVGRRRMLTGKDAQRAYSAGYGGIYQASLAVPDLFYPPLPTRVGKRLAFPIGSIGGVWALPELQYAEDMGCRIDKITTALIWETTDNLLAPWCQRIWDLRKTANPGLNRWLKYVLNSLTGKLGEKMEKSVLREYSTFKHDPKACPGSAGNCSCTDKHCTGGCNSWRPIDPDGKIWRKPVWRIPPNSRPHWAAYLTASARLSLLKRLRGTKENGVYCDTDSVYGSGEEHGEVGDELGQWKLEGEFVDWRCLAPKLYSFANPVTGDRTVKGKGFPGLDFNGFEKLDNGEKVDCGERPQSFLTGIKKGCVWTNRSIIKMIHPSEKWVGGRLRYGTRTLPANVEEIAKRK